MDSTADVTATDSQCTLREAIANADADSDTTGGDCAAGSGTDTISFDPSIFQGTITLSGTELSINSDLFIDGPNAGITVDGNATSRVFLVNSGTVTFNNLIITNGNLAGAGTLVGGGIRNSGNLTINDSRIDSNSLFSTNF
ncbi:MAG: hypothetical protein HC806_07525, partial [Anaerolineae bacterium]|nr:hypothetical protein [Anaerolineae bacterium]